MKFDFSFSELVRAIQRTPSWTILGFLEDEIPRYTAEERTILFRHIDKAKKEFEKGKHFRLKFGKCEVVMYNGVPISHCEYSIPYDGFWDDIKILHPTTKDIILNSRWNRIANPFYRPGEEEIENAYIGKGLREETQLRITPEDMERIEEMHRQEEQEIAQEKKKDEESKSRGKQK